MDFKVFGSARAYEGSDHNIVDANILTLRVEISPAVGFDLHRCHNSPNKWHACRSFAMRKMLVGTARRPQLGVITLPLMVPPILCFRQ